jgi:hypothetical protein
VLGAVVSVLVLAALAPTFFTAIGDLAGAFESADVNSTVGNSIANSVFPIMISLAGVFAIAGLAFAAYKFRKGKD